MNNWLRAITTIMVLAIGFGPVSAWSGSSPKKSEHGLYVQKWFANSTGDLRQDMAAALAENKILAVFWEQEGCHYCQEMHEVNLQDQDLVAYISKHFHVVQYDLRGAGNTKTWDGEALSQRELAGELGVRGTPTILFYRESGKEVTRMPGFAATPVFRKVFEYVVEKGDAEAGLVDWIRNKMSTETKG